MVTLVIMDGLGISKNRRGNAVKTQGMPYLKKLKKNFPHTIISASGESVGLTAGQMGNSEVGHLNLGAGRVVYQDLSRINNAITDGTFSKNEVLKDAINYAIKNNSNLHIMGLCSDGGVHSHVNHLMALIDMSKKMGVKNVYLHLFTDGRDTPTDSGLKFATKVEEYVKDKDAKICSICGRVYAMDREKRYDRVQKAYDMLTCYSSENLVRLKDAFENSYSKGVYDEFIEPTRLVDFTPIKDGDSVIYFNFRTDRGRELTEAFTQSEFNGFKTKGFKKLKFTTFTEYDAKFKNVCVAFPPEKIKDNLSAIISQNGMKQFHISETTKYAHVTFFFNGGIEEPNAGEDRKLIESENVINFAKTPKMKAYEITDEVLRAITDKKYDFILVNLSNADMIGHTGDFDAAVTAVETVDKCAYAIALATMMAGGDCIITADHGNAEEMLTKDGKPMTAHTTNLVPFILCSEKYKLAKLKKKQKLANVAPTVLQLLGIEIPNFMEETIIR